MSIRRAHSGLSASPGGTFLQYRTFAAADQVNTNLGSLASDATNSFTVAFCVRINTISGDGMFISTPSFNPIDLYIYSSGTQLASWDGSSNSFGPGVSTGHGFVIFVYTKDSSTSVEWSYYRFDTDTWSHSTPGPTHGANAFPGSDTLHHGKQPFVNSMIGDFVCSAIWTGTKLNTTQRATLSDSFAAWAALSPTEAWNYGESTPGNSVIGTATQTSISGTTLGSDSPLLES